MMASNSATPKKGVSYSLKYSLAWTNQSLRNLLEHRTFEPYDFEKNYKDPYQTNVLYPAKERWIESPKDSLSFEGYDGLLFHGSDVDSGSQIIISFDRNLNHVARIFIFLYHDGKIYQTSEDHLYDKSNGASFFAGGLLLEHILPMRTWRIVYNGTMKCNGTDVHVKFTIRFATGSHPFEYPYDFEKSERISSLVSKGWSHVFSGSNIEEYEQAGTLYSEINIDGKKSHPTFFGSRIRSLKETALAGEHFLGYSHSGSVFHIRSEEDSLQGYCYSLAHFNKPLVNCSMIRSEDNEVMFNVTAGHITYKLNLKQLHHKSWTNQGIINSLKLYQGTGKANGKDIRVLFFTLPRNNIHSDAFRLKIYSEVPAHDHTAVVVSTAEDICKDPSLTGGKGSSLAVLAHIAREKKKVIFSPAAVVLTVKAHEHFTSIDVVRQSLENLKLAAKRGQSIDEVCDATVKALSGVEFPQYLIRGVSEKMEETFGSSWTKRFFAVRSSAVGEDSEEMSAAGQMTTFLNCGGIENITQAAVKCWASQYSKIAVNYKRQYGQEVCSRMAVVIQEMASPMCAGVLFTCNPLTSNPLQTTITANYGLGESVVSASADPDTITLQRQAIGKTNFEIVDMTVGAKKERIMSLPKGGTYTEKVPESDASKASLSPDLAMQLAIIAAMIEQDYGGGCRDMEWAYNNKTFYLLQCRPVTSIYRESDFDITHEFNTAIMSNTELLSRANLDEVLPGVPSTCAIDSSLSFDLFCRRFLAGHNPSIPYETSPYTRSGMISYGQKAFLNMSAPTYDMSEPENVKAFIIGIFGSDVSDQFKNANLYEIHKNNFVDAVLKVWNCFKMLVFFPSTVTRARRIEANYKIPITDDMTSEEMLDCIIENIHKARHVGCELYESSGAAMVYNMILMSMISNCLNEKEPSQKTFSLVSRFLKSGDDVESANIPASMRKLADAIRASSKGAVFNSMSDDEAVVWLGTTEEDAGKQYRMFIKRHRHRCYKEFDPYSDPWGVKPQKLIRSLKAAALANVKEDDDAEILTVDHLPGKPGFITRMLFGFLLPRARYAVYSREACKSSVIACTHTYRLALRKLGKRLVEEGRLPNEELIHFLILDEIKTLIRTRNPTLVARAKTRHRLHPSLDKLTHPMLQCGIPKSSSADDVVIDPNCKQWKGTPVSEGQIEGKARVILDFESESHLITKGEILVTNATDTGWTPYFPLLSGVVTQMGGLLSHGAVVAREYGLPAVVGVEAITKSITSGDIIHINGTTGLVSLIRRGDEK